MFHPDAGLAPPLPPWQAVLRLTCDGTHPAWDVARAASVMLVDYFGLPSTNGSNNNNNNNGSGKNSAKNSAKSGGGGGAPRGGSTSMGSPHSGSAKSSEKEGGSHGAGASTKGNTYYITSLFGEQFHFHHTLTTPSHHTSQPTYHTLSPPHTPSHHSLLKQTRPP